MRKRQKFVLTALLLSVGLTLIQFIPLEFRYISIAFLTAMTWVLSAWSLKEGLSGLEWITVLMPMTLFTGGVGFFYILLPGSWIAKLIIVVLFAIGQYALLLTGNIFSVAAIRTIALLRAAQAVGFLMTLLTGFFVFNTVLSFRHGFWWNAPFVFLGSLLLLLPALWSVRLEVKLTRELVMHSLTLSALLAMMSVAISIWPISLAVASLFLTTMLYTYLGITQHHFSERLFKRTAWEYIMVGVIVLVTMLLTSGA